MKKEIIISEKYLRTQRIDLNSECHVKGYEFDPIEGLCNNFNARKGGGVPLYIMQHHTVSNYDRAMKIFTSNKGGELWNCSSAHYVINVEGNIDCIVNPDYRAYHAGRGFILKGSKLNYESLVPENDINSWSIGIENVNNGYTKFTKDQMIANINLMDLLKTNYKSIDTKKVIGHADWDPARKCDPNPYFDWKLAANASNACGVDYDFGVYPTIEYNSDSNEIISGVSPEKTSKEYIEELQNALAGIGYNVFLKNKENAGIYDLQTRNCVKAFKNHYMNEVVVENLQDFKLYENYDNHDPFMITVTENTFDIIGDVADLL